ncbi:MAG: ABC transporter substrate-binding protein [Lachnospiraceae bacterium]|nr:ABC transporter substrate-binding protein [Lachnospiraceae bacterium]
MTGRLKRITAVLSVLTILVCSLSGCTKTPSEELTKVTLNEVAHSIFYAPQYVAIELGYFEEEGIDLELVTGFGADKTMSALVAGEADIGFMGSESSIYLYNEGAEDYAVNFAQLTQRAGNFLVAREATENFQWEDLKGKEIIGGRPGGMPEMVLEYILKLNDIDPETDVTLVQNIDFGNTSGAFAGGTGDYTVEFEPSATALEQEGVGYVVASLGVDSGYVPYTAYCARQRYIEENPEVIQKFTNAMQRGMDYVNTHTPEEIAEVIAPQFEETDVKTIALIVERYASQDTWKEDLIFEEDSFQLLQNILDEAGELETFAPYENLVDTSYAEKALEETK